ncbi:cyclic nucleotide-binding domain-containing protein [Methylomagnum sp.]
MSEIPFYALEYRELNAIRWQSDKDGEPLYFKISESGLIPVNSEADCDIAIGRSAVYLYKTAGRGATSGVRSLPPRPSSADAAGRGALELLVRTEVFDPLDGEQLRELSKQLVERKCFAGTVIVRQDDAGDSLFVIADGAMNVTAHDAEGHERHITTLKPGACFGEMSLLTGAPRSATVTAEADSVVYEIRREHLRPLMKDRMEIVQGLSELMAERQMADAYRKQHESLRDSEGESLVTAFSKKIGELFGLKSAGRG